MTTKVGEISEFGFNYKDDFQTVTPTVNPYSEYGSSKEHPVNVAFKLYPYEWIVKESDEQFMADMQDAEVVEPAWKLIVGNKALLPLLWEMFPNHPNLMPAYFINPKDQLNRNSKDIENKNDEFKMNYDDLKVENWVSKPKYGREGENVLFSNDFYSFDSFVSASERQPDLSPITKMPLGRSIYQQCFALPNVQTRTVLTSSWVINGMPAGLCFREDTSRLTNNNSGFLPHYIQYKDNDGKRQLHFRADDFQTNIRK